MKSKIYFGLTLLGEELQSGKGAEAQVGLPHLEMGPPSVFLSGKRFLRKSGRPVYGLNPGVPEGQVLPTRIWRPPRNELLQNIPIYFQVGWYENLYPGVAGAASAHLDMEPPHGVPPCTAEWNQLAGYPTIYSTQVSPVLHAHQISSPSPAAY